MKYSQKGFNILLLPIILVILAAIVLVGFSVKNSHTAKKTTHSVSSKQITYKSLSTSGHAFAVTVNFDSNAQITKDYTAGQTNSYGILTGYIDLVVFKGQDLKDHQPLYLSVEQLAKDNVGQKLTCPAKVGDTVHNPLQPGITTYFIATLMGQQIPFCGQDQIDISNQIALPKSNYLIALNRPDGTTMAIDSTLAQQIVSSINIRELH